MDLDDIQPRPSSDLLSQLARQDLDPLSVDELHARIAQLESEIVRARTRIDRAFNHRANAEGLFKQ
jgi:uncharacterized small protein (DUF1192 family)